MDHEEVFDTLHRQDPDHTTSMTSVEASSRKARNRESQRQYSQSIYYIYFTGTG
jgi:hypothetical protein